MALESCKGLWYARIYGSDFVLNKTEEGWCNGWKTFKYACLSLDRLEDQKEVKPKNLLIPINLIKFNTEMEN